MIVLIHKKTLNLAANSSIRNYRAKERPDLRRNRHFCPEMVCLAVNNMKAEAHDCFRFGVETFQPHLDSFHMPKKPSILKIEKNCGILLGFIHSPAANKCKGLRRWEHCSFSVWAWNRVLRDY
jgi:hypothetical protein